MHGPAGAEEGSDSAAAPRVSGARTRKLRAPLQRDGAISEEELVRELLFVMQGIEGAHIRWNYSKEAFVFQLGSAGQAGSAESQGAEGSSDGNLSLSETAAAAGLAPGTIQMVERIAELGWMYRTVVGFVESCTGEVAGVSREAAMASGCRNGSRGGSGATLGSSLDTCLLYTSPSPRD